MLISPVELLLHVWRGQTASLRLVTEASLLQLLSSPHTSIVSSLLPRLLQTTHASLHRQRRRRRQEEEEERKMVYDAEIDVDGDKGDDELRKKKSLPERVNEKEEENKKQTSLDTTETREGGHDVNKPLPVEDLLLGVARRGERSSIERPFIVRSLSLACVESPSLWEWRYLLHGRTPLQRSSDEEAKKRSRIGQRMKHMHEIKSRSRRGGRTRRRTSSEILYEEGELDDGEFDSSSSSVKEMRKGGNRGIGEHTIEGYQDERKKKKMRDRTYDRQSLSSRKIEDSDGEEEEDLIASDTSNSSSSRSGSSVCTVGSSCRSLEEETEDELYLSSEEDDKRERNDRRKGKKQSEEEEESDDPSDQQEEEDEEDEEEEEEEEEEDFFGVDKKKKNKKRSKVWMKKMKKKSLHTPSSLHRRHHFRENEEKDLSSSSKQYRKYIRESLLSTCLIKKVTNLLQRKKAEKSLTLRPSHPCLHREKISPYVDTDSSLSFFIDLFSQTLAKSFFSCSSSLLRGENERERADKEREEMEVLQGERRDSSPSHFQTSQVVQDEEDPRRKHANRQDHEEEEDRKEERREGRTSSIRDYCLLGLLLVWIDENFLLFSSFPSEARERNDERVKEVLMSLDRLAISCSSLSDSLSLLPSLAPRMKEDSYHFSRGTTSLLERKSPLYLHDKKEEEKEEEEKSRKVSSYSSADPGAGVSKEGKIPLEKRSLIERWMRVKELGEKVFPSSLLVPSETLKRVKDTLLLLQEEEEGEEEEGGSVCSERLKEKNDDAIVAVRAGEKIEGMTSTRRRRRARRDTGKMLSHHSSPFHRCAILEECLSSFFDGMHEAEELLYLQRLVYLMSLGRSHLPSSSSSHSIALSILSSNLFLHTKGLLPPNGDDDADGVLPMSRHATSHAYSRHTNHRCIASHRAIFSSSVLQTCPSTVKRCGASPTIDRKTSLLMPSPSLSLLLASCYQDKEERTAWGSRCFSIGYLRRRQPCRREVLSSYVKIDEESFYEILLKRLEEILGSSARRSLDEDDQDKKLDKHDETRKGLFTCNMKKDDDDDNVRSDRQNCSHSERVSSLERRCEEEDEKVALRLKAIYIYTCLLCGHYQGSIQFECHDHRHSHHGDDDNRHSGENRHSVDNNEDDHRFETSPGDRRSVCLKLPSRCEGDVEVKKSKKIMNSSFAEEGASEDGDLHLGENEERLDQPLNESVSTEDRKGDLQEGTAEEDRMMREKKVKMKKKKGEEKGGGMMYLSLEGMKSHGGILCSCLVCRGDLRRVSVFHP
ncbi:hypothetical protein CSUI_005838 [Cystoisospora suis]|uniref:Uncharacterized protein n=1 Tax=Cystoisospora suis TaxID=483139 RepID=A0A2C6KTU3_9APIC|nr:hypothetical protein CSUI_005838 [Cystoisospora suis]